MSEEKSGIKHTMYGKVRTIAQSGDAGADGGSFRYIVSVTKYISNRCLLLPKSGA